MTCYSAETAYSVKTVTRATNPTNHYSCSFSIGNDILANGVERFTVTMVFGCQKMKDFASLMNLVGMRGVTASGRLSRRR